MPQFSRLTSILALAIALTVSGSIEAEPPRDPSVEYTRTLTFDSSKADPWVEMPPPPPGTAEGDLFVIRKQVHDGQNVKALRGVKKFEKDYTRNDPNYPALLIAKAEAQIGRRDYVKAHETLQAFLNEFGGMSLTEEALRNEFVIAETFLGGEKRKVLGIRMLSGIELAFEILDDITFDYPESRYALLALKTKADYFYREGDFALAELEYARLLEQFPRSRYHRYALRATAESALASHGGLEFDEAPLIEAEERYREYRGSYPAAAEAEGVTTVLVGIREQRAAKEYDVGQYYEKTDHLSSAIFYYRSVADNWPDTVAATKARGRLELLGGGMAPAEDSAGSSEG